MMCRRVLPHVDRVDTQNTGEQQPVGKGVLKPAVSTSVSPTWPLIILRSMVLPLDDVRVSSCASRQPAES